MDTGKAILIGGAVVGGVLIVRALQQRAQQLPPGANAGAASSAVSLAHPPSTDSLDKLAHDTTSAVLQSQGVPKPLADAAANYNFVANAKRLAPVVQKGAGWIATGAGEVYSGAKTVVGGAVSAGKSALNTVTFGLL
jgi:hypothetical protein